MTVTFTAYDEIEIADEQRAEIDASDAAMQRAIEEMAASFDRASALIDNLFRADEITPVQRVGASRAPGGLTHPRPRPVPSFFRGGGA